MSFTRITNITVNGGCMPMGGMMPPPPPPMMGGCCHNRPLWGFGFPGHPYMNGAMAAGMCTGMALAIPGVMQGIGQAAKWTYNNILKPVGSFAWNNVLKPVWNFAHDNILRPLGKGLKWVWDHTLGWVFKQMDKIGSKKTDKS